MHKRIEDFSMQELVERRAIQELLRIILDALKVALDEQRYDDAVFLNINGARSLKMMIERELSLPEETLMLETLRSNVYSILKIQYRLQ